MRTIEVNLFQFDELDDKAKTKARKWYRDASASDNSFSQFVIEDAEDVASCLGITLKARSYKTLGGHTRSEPCIYWSGFWSQGNGACFEGSYEAPDGKALDLVKAHAPKDEKLHIIAAILDALQEQYRNDLTATIVQHGSYYHSDTMYLDQVDADDADGNPVDVTAEDQDHLLHAIRAFANWIYRQLEQEYDYQNSDECVDETIRINEYEFYADGGRACRHA
jgi:hypothetical protein